MGSVLLNSIKYVPGVGEARAKLLEKELGVATLGDMLYHFPFRYIDQTSQSKVKKSKIQEDISMYIKRNSKCKTVLISMFPTISIYLA